MLLRLLAASSALVLGTTSRAAGRVNQRWCGCARQGRIDRRICPQSIQPWATAEIDSAARQLTHAGVTHKPGFQLPALSARSNLMDSINSAKSNSHFTYARGLAVSHRILRAWPREETTGCRAEHGCGMLVLFVSRFLARIARARRNTANASPCCFSITPVPKPLGCPAEP